MSEERQVNQENVSAPPPGQDEKARLDEELRRKAEQRTAPPDAPAGCADVVEADELAPGLTSLECALIAIVWHLTSANGYRVADEVKRHGGALGAATSTVRRTLKNLAASGYLTRRSEGTQRKPALV